MDVVRGEEVKGFWRRAVADQRAEYYLSLRAPQVIFRRYDRGMRVAPLVLGTLLILGGLVWIAQGLNLPFAPKSFMTADRAWVVIGAVAALCGAILIGRSRRAAR